MLCIRLLVLLGRLGLDCLGRMHAAVTRRLFLHPHKHPRPLDRAVRDIKFEALQIHGSMRAANLLLIDKILCLALACRFGILNGLRVLFLLLFQLLCVLELLLDCFLSCIRIRLYVWQPSQLVRRMFDKPRRSTAYCQCSRKRS